MRVIEQTPEMVPLAAVHPSPENVNEGDVGAISASIEHNGWYGYVLAQRSSGAIIAGEHRWRAAQALGAAEVPVLWADVDDATARRIRLADNRTTRLGHDDSLGLADLLSSLALTDEGLAGTGYDGDDLDDLLRSLSESTALAVDGDGDTDADERTRPRLTNGPTFVKAVLAVDDVATCEEALARTGEQNRGLALTLVCRAYLAAHPAVGASA